MEVNQNAIKKMPYSELKAMKTDIQRIKPKEIGATPLDMKALLNEINAEMKSRFRALFFDKEYFEEQERIRKEKIQKLKEQSKYDEAVYSDDPSEYYLLLRKLNAHVSVKMKVGVTEEIKKHQGAEYFSYKICAKKTKKKITSDASVIENPEIGFKEAHVMMECALSHLVDLCMPSKMEAVK